MKRTFQFVLQFDPSEIDGLAERYGYKQDSEAFAAGKDIAGGNYSRENLNDIVRWKSARRIALLCDNTDEDIARTLQFATAPSTSEGSAVEVLDNLRGVGVPVASAILTAINPLRYTVIDFRALESLGVAKWPKGSIAYYVAYLSACRDLARQYNKPLRTLDRALWQWSKERGRQTKCLRTRRAL
jgi:hypothetical protein